RQANPTYAMTSDTAKTTASAQSRRTVNMARISSAEGAAGRDGTAVCGIRSRSTIMIRGARPARAKIAQNASELRQCERSARGTANIGGRNVENAIIVV